MKMLIETPYPYFGYLTDAAFGYALLTTANDQDYKYYSARLNMWIK